MNAVLAGSLCNLFAGLLCVVLSVPLIRGKAKPGAFYGARTAKTLSCDKTWYRVNAAFGRWLLAMGFATAASGVVGWLLVPVAPGSWLVAGLTVCAFLPALAAVPVLTDRPPTPPSAE